MPDINDVNGNPAIETDEPMSIQEANEWAIEARGKADPRKAAIERLKWAAARRRERKPVNPLETLKPDPSYKVRDYNAEADAFNVESSDGKKLLGKSLSNGNVRNGQKVRSFFAPNGQVVIDVKPKGRDIAIPKPQAQPPVDEPDIWPVTSCFLYSKLKETQEDLTDNLATDLTSYDAWQSVFVTGSPTFERVVLFTQRSDTMGDYETANDALANNLKEDRKLKPGNTGAGSGGAADNAAWSSQSPDARIIWYHIGDPTDILQNGKIFKVSGPPIGHPSAGNVTNSGPGFVMQVYGSGIASAIFPSENIGQEPLTKKLKESFPDLGGEIGYAGRIERWRGQQDYVSGAFYSRNVPNNSGEYQTPVSFPPSYVPGDLPNPWNRTNASWFQFGWPDPQYIGCASSSWINAESSAFADMECGASIPPDKWYWGGDAAPYYVRIDKDNPSGFIGTNGMFVCWKGHKDNAGLARSFFEAFKDYWGITGSVTVLGSVNPSGCGTGDPGGGSGYPPPPPGLRRFLVTQLGRKAEIWLKVCEKDYPPIELRLPFEFAALIEKFVVQGAPSLNTWPSSQQNAFLTAGGNYGIGFTFCLEAPHATMSSDGEFVYVNISYGGEREWENPLSKPIPCKLSNLGSGDFSGITWYRQLAQKESGALIIGQYAGPGTVEMAPRYKSDHFAYCQSYKIALPTSSTNRELTIIGSQRYRRGETIELTAQSPDTEFDNKFLIFDFRTDKLEGFKTPPEAGLGSNTFANWQAPNTEYASFGGLPALLQLAIPGYPVLSLAHFNAIEKFYKPQSSWTDMDKIHFELMEAPETFYPFNTVLPPGVFVAPYSSQHHHVRFMLDGKFGRGGRSESIGRPSTFGYEYRDAPSYSLYSDYGNFLLFTSFKEQLIGNGIKNNEGLITKWNKVSTSSFPIFGQVIRNGF